MAKPSELTNEELIIFQIAELDELINSLCYFYTYHEADFFVTSEWRAKDVLAHIVSWHESFARILKDITTNSKPRVLKGRLHELNQIEVEKRKNLKTVELIHNLQEAQKTIKLLATTPNLGLIPYKKGSRSYGILEHLQVVYKHVKKHFKKIKVRHAETKK